MSNEKIISFDEALLNIANSSATAWVYLPIERNWNLNSKCAVLESEEVPPESEDDPDAGLPEFAKRNRLMQVLPVTVIQDIMTNARMKKPGATLDDFFRAFLYYHKHDAFIDLTN